MACSAFNIYSLQLDFYTINLLLPRRSFSFIFAALLKRVVKITTHFPFDSTTINGDFSLKILVKFAWFYSLHWLHHLMVCQLIEELPLESMAQCMMLMVCCHSLTTLHSYSVSMNFYCIEVQLDVRNIA